MELAHGPEAALEGLSQAIAGLMPDQPLSGPLGGRKGVLSASQPGDRKSPSTAARGFRDWRGRRISDKGRGYEVGENQFLIVDDEEELGDQLVEYGVSRRAIAPAIAAGVALCLLVLNQSEVIVSNIRPSNEYRLTYVAEKDRRAPSDEWATVTRDQANQVASVFRATIAKTKASSLSCTRLVPFPAKKPAPPVPFPAKLQCQKGHYLLYLGGTPL